MGAPTKNKQRAKVISLKNKKQSLRPSQPQTTQAPIKASNSNSPVVPSKLSHFEKYLPLFALLPGLLGGWLFLGQYLTKVSGKTSATSTWSSSATAESLTPEKVQEIDMYLQKAESLKKIREMAVQKANEATAPKINPSQIAAVDMLKPPAQEYGVKMDQEDHSSQVYKDTHFDDEKKSLKLSPADRIEARIAQRKWQEAYDKAFREEFVQQFVENAKKDGFIVNVNEKMDVIGVMKTQKQEPIRLPMSFRPSKYSDDLSKLASGETSPQ